MDVCKFKSEEETYILRGSLDPETFWMVIIDNSTNQIEEDPNRQISWEGAVNLLKKYRWEECETISVEPLFEEKIIEARNIEFDAQERILSMLLRFQQGEEMSKRQLAEGYKTGEGTIERDIKKLRDFVSVYNKEIVYDRGENVYKLSSADGVLNKGDAITILLLLYSSRVLNREEVQKLTIKIIELVSYEDQRGLKQFLNSFIFHYQPVQQNNMLELVSEIFKAICQKKMLTFKYHKPTETTMREVIPYSLTVHEGIFYLLASKKDSDYKEPVPWRLDRMSDCKVKNEKFRYVGPHLEVGAYLNRSVNMFSGKTTNVQLKVHKGIIEYLQRAFPIVKQIAEIDEEWCMVEVEVKGLEGIRFWIVKQAEYVEVIKPVLLREEVKEKISKMYQMYFSDIAT